MIKLTLPARPKELTEEIEKSLADDFKRNGSEVWKKPFIKEAVLDIAYGKCAYSEVRLVEEGKFMQVDHFYPKSIYPDLVAQWGNLLPALNHCNMKKSNLDPNKIDIINPLKDDPKDGLYFINGMLYGKNEKGCNTIQYLDLNNQRQINEPRYRLLKEIHKQLKDIGFSKERDVPYFIRRLGEIMSCGGRKSVYSAAVSTFILGNECYKHYRDFLVEQGMWDERFCKLEEEMRFCSLPNE